MNEFSINIFALEAFEIEIYLSFPSLHLNKVLISFLIYTIFFQRKIENPFKCKVYLIA